MKSIGRVIRDRRIQKELRLQDIAGPVKASVSHIGGVERDEVFTEPHILENLAKVLDLDDTTLDYLMDMNEREVLGDENNVGAPIKRVRPAKYGKRQKPEAPNEKPRAELEAVVVPKETAASKAVLDKDTVTSIIQSLAEEQNYEAIEKLMSFLKETAK